MIKPLNLSKSSYINIIISFLTIMFLLFLIVFANNNILAVQNGIKLWGNKIVPSIFPFLIAIEMLSYTNIPKKISDLLNPIMKPLFNLPGCGAYALFLGLISGYPTGAKIVLNLYENNLCSKSEAERMLSFTNNSGPLFILGTVGIIMFSSIEIGILLLISHVLSSVTIGLLLGFFSKFNNYNKTNKTKFELENKNFFQINKKAMNLSQISLGKIITNSVKNAIETILMIGGLVVFFSLIISILNNLKIVEAICNFLHLPIIFNNYLHGFFSGLIEITSGLSIISLIQVKRISLSIILSSFLLGFGGISVLLQVMSIVHKTNFSIKKYIISKFFQGIIAIFYTYLLLSCFSFLNLDL